LIAGLALWLPASAWSIETLEDAIREIQRLQQRVQELEAADRLRSAPAPDTSDSGFELEAYGFVRLDAVYDDSRPNDPQVIGYVRPESGLADDEGSFSLYPRLSRFGFNLKGPSIEGLGGPKTSGRMEMDFYAFPASDSRNQIRMRHVWLALDWERFRLLAGQTSDLISPRYPAVNADLVMWGAGNLGDRRPQLRLDYRQPFAEGHELLLQGAIGLSGANSGDDLDGDGFLDGEASGRPTYQARAAYRAAAPWTDADLELGVWAHRAWQEVDVAIAGQRSFDSRALGIDWALPLYGRRLSFQGELWSGKNLEDVRGGIFQGVNPNTGDEIESRGGWLELGWRPFAQQVVSLGFSWDDPDNGDLTRGDSSVNRASNRIFYVSAVERRFFPLTFGVEYLRWTTHFVGDADGEDNRFKGFVSL
jgi:hypothetical protein